MLYRAVLKTFHVTVPFLFIVHLISTSRASHRAQQVVLVRGRFSYPFRLRPCFFVSSRIASSLSQIPIAWNVYFWITQFACSCSNVSSPSPHSCLPRYSQRGLHYLFSLQWSSFGLLNRSATANYPSLWIAHANDEEVEPRGRCYTSTEGIEGPRKST